MAPDDDFGPDSLTTKGIPTTRRGLDRRVVDRLMDQAREVWSRLEAEYEDLSAQIEDAGGLEHFTRDVRELGNEVGAILAAAREASDGMRERAAEKAERVLSEASTEADVTKAETARLASSMRSDAESDAFELRKDAWDEATELLEHIQATVEAMLERAEADVLIIRADAEQESHRRVAQARRESDDIVRNARFEAERTVTEAKALASEILEDANRDASAAQERTRALESRRRALLDELEEQRSSTGETGVRVMEEPRRPRQSDTIPDVRSEDAIDHLAVADELAADVEQLRDVPEELPAAPEEPVEPEAIAAPDAAAFDEEPELPEEPAAEEPADEEPEDAEEAVDDVEIDELEPVTVGVADSPGIVDDLFARLRGKPAAPTPAAPAPAVEEIAPDEAAEEVTEEVTEEESAPAGGADLIEPAALDAGDPVDLRDGLLLPVTNAALRDVKQAILDLQNLSLDGLRTDDGWSLSAPDVQGAFADAVGGLGADAATAGAAAAGAHIGRSVETPAAGTRGSELLRLMADDLVGQVKRALTDHADAGPRERGTAVSRVFRAWRSDEAERWVRTVAAAGYHDALTSTLAANGVGSVIGVAHGAPCDECPARLGDAWDPAGDPPGASRMPPAHRDCTCTVAPAG